MALITVLLPPLIPTSSGATVTNGIGLLNDARSITIFITSSANAGSSAGIIQISHVDPGTFASTVRQFGSTAWYTASSSALALPSTGAAVVMSNISFQGLRISGLSSANGGEIVAYVSKQIHV